VKNTTTLLLSTDADTLFVGAQDALLSLDVSQPDSITFKDKVREIVCYMFQFAKMNDLIMLTFCHEDLL